MSKTPPKKKPGRPKGSGKGRTSATKSICMHPDDWDRFDAQRLPLSRGEWIKARLKKSKPEKQA